MFWLFWSSKIVFTVHFQIAWSRGHNWTVQKLQQHIHPEVPEEGPLLFLVLRETQRRETEGVQPPVLSVCREERVGLAEKATTGVGRFSIMSTLGPFICTDVAALSCDGKLGWEKWWVSLWSKTENEASALPLLGLVLECWHSNQES